MAGMEQFSALPMATLIGAPLQACIDASRLCANATASFIQEVGFDDAKAKPAVVRQIDFSYKRPVEVKETTPGSPPTSVVKYQTQEVSLSVPLLAIVPIPTFQVQTCTIDFEMEVQATEGSTSKTEAEASLTASGGWGPVKVEVSGKVSHSKETTRSSDTRAKYTVHVEAASTGLPEGLSRVLDMLNEAVAPTAVKTT